MKIGDKVRFLSEVGGGIIAGFQGKNIVLVEDSDGFQIPTAVNDVVVVGQDNYASINKVTTKQKKSGQQPKSPILSCNRNKIHDNLFESPIRFHSKPQEQENGDSLSLSLAFVPIDIQEITNTRFETFLINDSNYYINYTYLSAEGHVWRIKKCGFIEPNTKMYIEEFGHEDLNGMKHLAIQGIVFKRDKTFILKDPINLQLHLDTVKFYKLHVFQDNIFFEQKALIYPLIEDDQPMRNLLINTEEVKDSFKVSTINLNKSKAYSCHTKIDLSSDDRLGNRPIIVDLHASKLLTTTKGLSSTDILKYQMEVFHKFLTEYSSRKGCKIIFIYGKGTSVLRQTIIHELNYRNTTYTYQDASFQEYGYGAIQVSIL